MNAPDLSVVVASVNGFPYLGQCLDSLRDRCPDAEVIVADSTDEQTRRRIRDEWPEVQLLSFDEPTSIPVLRAAGIAVARAPNVAVIEDHCVVGNGWAETLVRRHRAGHAVVGGPIRNTATARVRDWAAFLFEYSSYMEPARSGSVQDLPGMNVSYDRRALAEIDDLLRAGKWESWLHARLQEQGFEFYCDADATLDHVKDFGIGEFLSQRFHYARAYAAMRAPDLGARRYVHVVAAPLLLPLLYLRIARNVHARGRDRLLARATPLLLLYIVATAAGEAAGYSAGGGRSLLRVR